jgi:hypothetical protein
MVGFGLPKPKNYFSELFGYNINKEFYMRTVSINTTSNGPIMAGIKPSKKAFINVGNPKIGVPNGEAIPVSKIKSVNVILDNEVKEISPDKFWSYDSIINILGEDD